jgi:hypothetical protein
VQSDYFPVLEYVAQKACFVREAAQAWKAFDERMSPRPQTLLGEYLSRQKPLEIDFNSFAEAYASHRLFRAEIFQSIVRRWQSDFPQSNLPLEISALGTDSPRDSETQLLRLAPFRERIFEISKADPDLLRSYEGFLMASYRNGRSAFFLPYARELDEALAQLMKDDPARRAVYELHLAELAWDRGDDAACLASGSKYFGLSQNHRPADLYRLDPKAVTAVLARLIDIRWRAGQFPEATDLCRQAQTLHRAASEPQVSDPFLDLVCRRVEKSGIVTQNR